MKTISRSEMTSSKVSIKDLELFIVEQIYFKDINQFLNVSCKDFGRKFLRNRLKTILIDWDRFSSRMSIEDRELSIVE